MKFSVKVFPYREKLGMGNIIWAQRDKGSEYYRVSKYAMRGGKFPPDHPVGGGAAGNAQFGNGANIMAFRALGYWASCFPEGDGITWRPLTGQSDEQSMDDIRSAFNWDAQWGCEIRPKHSQRMNHD